MTEQLWDLYRDEARKQLVFRHNDQVRKHPYEVFDRVMQDGIVKGILESLKVIEGKDVFMKAYEINCELAGIDFETGFMLWETTKKPPKKDGTYLVTLDGAICGNDEPIIGMCGYENGKWDEEGYVIAWMPLPHVFGELEGKPNDDQS